MKKISFAIVLIFMTVTAGAQSGSWSGKIDVQGTALSLVFHIDGDNPTMDSPDQGVKGIPAEVEKTDIGKITINIPSIGASYEGFNFGDKIVGTFRQRGASFALTLTPGEDRPKRPQTPQEPFPYTQEKVSFINGDATLKGTLVLPEGDSRETPVLVMVTGSGLQNRDEELFEHKPFAVIADALARRRIATLRYDDRGFGESVGDTAACTTEDFKNDALAGIKLLRERFGKVGVIGHSEGGTIALMLAAERQADFIVSLAGMVVSGKETLLWQNRTALISAGIPEDMTDAYCRLIGNAFEACITGAPMPSADGYGLSEALKRNYTAVKAQLLSPYMKYFLALDMRPLLGKIACPVLALNGAIDMQVECGSNLDALREGLPDNPSTRIEAIPGVNHLFQHCTTGSPAEYKEIGETFSPDTLDSIAQWISQVAGI